MSDPDERGIVDELDARTPLDRTIDRIGMGTYQWTLLSLCGFGWMADNMWIQAVAIILPRVQDQYSIPDSRIGALSSFMFAGMMIGAVGWGTCECPRSDLLGRSMAFNGTLLFTSLFGLLATITTSFWSLCIALFLLGSAVGGSMPTDGTLILEQLPNNKKYLVTALSIFFSFGAVFAAIAALIIIPRYTCFATDCDVTKGNLGWKYLLACLSVLTLLMTVFRVIFFRLYESPRYLVAAGRPMEAVENLQLISRFNGEELDLSLRDVWDHFGTQAFLPVTSSSIIFNADTEGSDETTKVSESTPDSADYNTTGETNAIRNNSYSFTTPTIESPSLSFIGTALHSPSQLHDHDHQRHHTGHSVAEDGEDDGQKVTPRSPRPRLTHTLGRRRSSVVSVPYRSTGWLPRFIRKPLRASLDRIASVLAPEWIWKTLTIWAMWFSTALAYTVFNVFLPKLLEMRLGGVTPQPSQRSTAGIQSVESSLEDSLWDVVIYSIGGCPGAILGAYLVESSFGRRWSLAGSTFLTAFFCLVFVKVDGPLLLKASTVGVSLAATTMWAILYGWTPEVFSTNVRGSACGIASALSRIGGMIAPILGGQLLTIDVSLPVYASVVTFVIAGICVLFLKEAEEQEEGENQRVILH
ncbi:MFS general substrate transporter [Thelephora ganbajun]|uniref:MFS general substrate transporter n=1 Tax=Thelephora ganbajun TaxID=370292 RepID=A0ACB6Z1H6_THEGA|nr:MFS general substrate transporter [Thelephora ganbajun]